MNANELTFGVEIETIAPRTAVTEHGLDIGSYHNGRQVPYLPTGWKAENDSSLRTGTSGYGCEIVSPVLKGAEGIAEVIAVLKALEEKGHRVNASCGVHVHIGWKRTWASTSLAKLITMVSHTEAGLYAITGTKNRERGIYANGIKQYGNHAAAKTAAEGDRRHLLNLNNLVSGSSKETVEFRAFSGSLRPTKIVGWISVCLGLVERALNAKRMPGWNPKPPTGGWKKAGPGQSEAERLMGYLAWGDGYAKIHGGKKYGWISDAVPMDEVKKEFRRLSRRYDSMA